jgi:membrane protein required for colicin V production
VFLSKQFHKGVRMNWLDIAIGGVLLLSFVGAFWNGLSREVVRLVALFAGILGGLWWYDELAVRWQPTIGNERIAAFAAFAAIVLGSLVAGIFVAWVLAKILRLSGLRWFDRVLGGAFGLVRGLAICVALVLAIVAFHPSADSTSVVAESRLAPVFFHGARAVAAVAPAKLKSQFSEGFQQVRGVWRGADERLKRKVDGAGSD